MMALDPLSSEHGVLGSAGKASVFAKKLGVFAKKRREASTYEFLGVGNTQQNPQGEAPVGMPKDTPHYWRGRLVKVRMPPRVQRA